MILIYTGRASEKHASSSSVMMAPPGSGDHDVRAWSLGSGREEQTEQVGLETKDALILSISKWRPFLATMQICRGSLQSAS